MDATDVYQEICRLLEQHNQAGVRVTPETDLAGDLNIDSTAAMNLMMEIEERFEIDIPLNRLAEVEKLKDLVGLVQEQIEGR